MPDVLAAAVLSPRGLLLVPDPEAPGGWTLPGGPWRFGEEPEAVLRHVAREATGAELAGVGNSLMAPGEAAGGAAATVQVVRTALAHEPSPGREPRANGVDHVWWPERRVPLVPWVRDHVVPRLRATGELRGPGGERLGRVPAAATIPLRHAVLRAGLPVDTVSDPDDDDPGTAFFAVLGPAGGVRSTANVRRVPPAWAPLDASWWQLRGMATAADARGGGHAAAVLWAALDHVEREGGQVWLNARPAAERLYERAGFVPGGPRWVDPAYGPHVTMRRDAPAA